MPNTTNRGYTYPASTADVRIWELMQELAEDVDTDVQTIVAKPIGRIVANAAQALADNTQVAITFLGTDDIDTHGQHNPASNSSRVTPNVEGYYRFTGTVFFESQATAVVSDINLRKNGSTPIAPGARMVPASTNAFSLTCSAIVSMNGSTDYVEILARQDSAGSDNTNQSLQFSSVFEWEYLRPL